GGCADAQGGSVLPEERAHGRHGRGLLVLREEAVTRILYILGCVGEPVAADSRSEPVARAAWLQPLCGRLPPFFPALQAPAATGGSRRGGRCGGRLAERAVGSRGLARAGSLGHVRHPLPWTSELEAPPDVRRVRRPPAAKRLRRQQATAVDRAGQL